MGERRVLSRSYRLPVHVKALADTIAARIRRRVPKTFEPTHIKGSVEWARDLAQIDLQNKDTWLLLARSNYQLAQYRELARAQGVVYTLPNGEWSWTLPYVRAARTYEHLRRGGKAGRAEVRQMLAYVDPRPKIVKGDNSELAWLDVFPFGDTTRTWMDTLKMSSYEREYVRALRRHGESLTEPGRVRIQTVHGAKGAEAQHVVLMTDISERVANAARLDPDAEHRVQYVAVTRAERRLVLIQPRTRIFWRF